MAEYTKNLDAYNKLISTDKKAAKAPKMPPTPFVVFVGKFKKTYEQANPDNKSGAPICSTAAEQWESMSEAEKAPYIEEVKKERLEYIKKLEAFKLEKDLYITEAKKRRFEDIKKLEADNNKQVYLQAMK